MAKILTNAGSAKTLLDSHRPVIVFDTETTGLQPSADYIIEFSAFLYEWDGSKWVKTGAFEEYICPPIPLPAKITELTGISNEQLEGKDPEEIVFRRIFDFMCRGRIFVGQNISFDIGMLNAMAKRQSQYSFDPKNTIDTLKIARELIDKKDLKDGSYKLENLAAYYMVTTEGFHNSSVDIQNTWDVLMSEMKDYEVQAEEETARPVDSDFRVTSMKRWKKAYSRTRRVDRMYIRTTKGEVVYDFVNNTITAKDGSPSPLDPERLVSEMNRVALNLGYDSYEKVS